MSGIGKYAGEPFVRRAVTAAGSVAVAATVAVSGMASATAQTMQTNRQASSCNGGWNYSPWWGDSAGSKCWNPAYVKGWVADSYRDGKCVQMRFDWYRNGKWAGTKYSPRVCDAAHARDFELTSPDPHAESVNWDFYRV